MNRADIEREYRVVSGRIVNPGKFEGEAIYVPYFWGQDADGEDDDMRLIYTVTDDDRAQFPELVGIERVVLWEDANGFVGQC